MNPELQLEKIRAFHCTYKQYDILEAIDEKVLVSDPAHHHLVVIDARLFLTAMEHAEPAP